MSTVIHKSLEDYQAILECLYAEYFSEISEHSEVTSSYWKKVGWQKVMKKDGEWNAEGFGFGCFRPSRPGNNFKFLPQKPLLSHLIKKYRCPQNLIDAGRQVAGQSGRIFDFDCLKQVLSLHKILTLVGSNGRLADQGIGTVCIIGDGYGFFTSLLKRFDPQIRVVTVNLGRTLFFDVLYSQKCIPECKPFLLTEKNKLALSGHSLTFIEAEHYDYLEGLPINLFVNIASMQEMDANVIDGYFKYMRSSAGSPCYFYCCNRQEKTLPDGTVTEFARYPWQKSRILLDELCPWYQKYPSSKPPFWLPFDGPFQHRFVQFK